MTQQKTDQGAELRGGRDRYRIEHDRGGKRQHD